MKFFLFIVVCIVVALPASAFHIVGGTISYECLGGANYKITMKVWRDCYCTGCADLDDPAPIFAFSGAGAALGYKKVTLDGPYHLPSFVSNPCLQSPPDVCVEEGRYVVNWNFGSVPASGIYIVYQRCCRNSSITNLTMPDAQGSSYIAYIPPPSVVTCNSSPYFNQYPPVAICGDDYLVFDHSGTDPDGDSLVYGLCDPYVGLSVGVPSAIDISGTVDPSAVPPPPYDHVNWVGGFDAANPMHGTNPLTINSSTGLLTGFGFPSGQYVVGVCVSEYRGGNLICTTLRDFQFNVVQCNPLVVAALPDDYRACDDYTIGFENFSTGGTNYLWNFGDFASFTDTSSVFEPQYTYPDTGVYSISLVVNPGTPCTDTAEANVYVYPGFLPDFVVNTDCPLEEIEFNNTSTIVFGNINSTTWDFGDGTTSSDYSPTHIYDVGGVKTVTLLSTSDKGCEESITQDLYIFENPDLEAGDSIVIYQGDPAFLKATGAVNYTWYNAELQEISTIANPVVHPTQNTYYIVSTISSYGCLLSDTVYVYVLERPTFLLPTSFSPNGDNINDILFLNTNNISKLEEWAVYNRWGERVFFSTNIMEGWDGVYKGKPQEIGTYVYYAKATGINNEPLFIKGNVTLVR